MIFVYFKATAVVFNFHLFGTRDRVTGGWLFELSADIQNPYTKLDSCKIRYYQQKRFAIEQLMGVVKCCVLSDC